MTNLPITSNNSQPSAKVASAAKKDASTNMQSADPFGAVLARQMDETNTSASNMSSTAAGVDGKTVSDSAASTGKAEPDKVPTDSSTSGDPSSALAIMLQLSPEIRASAAKDVSSSSTATALELNVGKAVDNQLADNISAAQANTKIDLTTAASGKPDTAVMVADSATDGASKPAADKSGANQPVVNFSASQANARIDLAATPGKSGVAIMATDKPALHSGASLEITKPAELPNSLQSAAQSAQGPALSTASMATSGMTSGMLTNNKISDSSQIISSPLGSSGWSDEFSQKISWMGTQRNQVAELHLNPPNLGPLDVVLKISDNQATAMFTSPHSAVRDAVENAMPRLREILADNGITLGNTTVSDQSPRDRSANGFSGNGTAAQRESADDASRLASLSAAAQPVAMRRHHGMVDTFA